MCYNKSGDIMKKLIIIASTIILIVLITLTLFCPFLSIKLKGNNIIEINIFEEYKEQGYTSSFFGKKIDDVKVTGSVDSSKIGKYKITYETKKFFFTKKIVRTINVVDKDKPIITLKGEKTIEMCPNNNYEEEGYSAEDNYDGDITNKVVVTNSDNYIEYKVSDSSKNETIIKRQLNKIDKNVPEIKLNGENIIYVVKGNTYNDPSIIVTDNCDTKLNDKVKVEGTVDTNKVGEYTITYKVSDSSNNKASITRAVVVYEKEETGFYQNIVMGPTYIKGILIVNKNYALPSTYNNGVDATAQNALYTLQNAASSNGYTISTLSGFRTYNHQSGLYNGYVNQYGVALADTISARPGHSEHQSGLAFDVGAIDNNYGDTNEGIWLKNNAHKYGFIIRYPKGKEYITGYSYEPWHIRYVGVDASTYIYNNNLTLEEYLGI